MADRVETKNNWSYRNSYRWKRNFPQCNSDRQSPINIDTSKVSECNELCRLSTRYNPSKCHIINKNRTPTLRYDSGSYIKFRGVLYELSKITLHTPSMHTFNGSHYDMEVQLYHCNNISNCESGVILSIFLKRGNADSEANKFFSEFINRIPTEETEIEKEIPVSDNWNINSIFPDVKSFFYYRGSLPTPPCDPNWVWVLFEEVVTIGKTNYDALKFVFKDNIRIVRPLKGRTIYYNSSIKFDGADEYETLQIDQQIATLQKRKHELSNKNKNNTIKNVKRDETHALEVMDYNKSITQMWYKENKMLIKGILITMVFILIIYACVKMAKYIIRSGALTNFMQTQIENLEKREQSNKTKSSSNINGSNINNIDNINRNNMNMNNINRNNMNMNNINDNNMNIKEQNNKSTNKPSAIETTTNKNNLNKNLNNNLNNLNNLK